MKKGKGDQEREGAIRETSKEREEEEINKRE